MLFMLRESILVGAAAATAVVALALVVAFDPSSAEAFVSSQSLHHYGKRRLFQKSVMTSRQMFTGIIEEMGEVVSLVERDDMILWDGSIASGTEIAIKAKVVMQDAYLGCSICVSGVCLTATELHENEQIFKAGLSPETLRRTYLGSLKHGDAVNLERASEIGGRNSGHFVQGHVDGTGQVIYRWTDKESLFYKIAVSPEMMRHIVSKGFIAVDGTSLTVVECNYVENWFTFMLVEYTQKHIIIPAKQAGDLVNLEVDVLGKYSESTMAAMLPRLEALEAKVASLEKTISTSKAFDMS